jgi:hypothetical protein
MIKLTLCFYMWFLFGLIKIKTRCNTRFARVFIYFILGHKMWILQVGVLHELIHFFLYYY